MGAEELAAAPGKASPAEAAEAPTKLPAPLTVAYSLPAVAFGALLLIFATELPAFYTDTLGINIRTVGNALFAAQMFDAWTDPPVGFLSDRTTTRFGRRKVYVCVGSVLAAASAIALVFPPDPVTIMIP